ncbi:MAG: hypothetical protein ACYDC3_18415 [Candidatus Binataceae bacterium]
MSAVHVSPRRMPFDWFGETTKAARPAMPTNLVNLDALIPRQDFEFVEEDMPEAQPRPAIDLTHLEPGNFFYFALRKPDFQRETASWSPEKVADFIATFRITN